MIDITQTNAVAIGVFDGVHKGHRRVVETAAAQQGRTLACTFETGSITSKGADYRPIYGSEIKRRILTSLGVDDVYSMDFGQIRGLSGDTFFTEILYYRLKAHTVVCGRDFRFGKGAAFGVDELRALCSSHGVKLIAVNEVTDGGEKISSTGIRRLISEGQIDRANDLLGEPYMICGEVIHGNHIGTEIGFPTANIAMDENNIMPKFGVYRSYVIMDGERYESISNIGVKPTVGSRAPLCETHIPGISGDLYGKALEVRLTGMIRAERKFDGIDDLKKQISADLDTLKG
ncbi:MAG: riboflavin biosynthesis protein RibF [Oscillospiraceae bacterium]|nr:riboflavin biosynthesis protein RibF [Oscillospiraceae bacterium]